MPKPPDKKGKRSPQKAQEQFIENMADPAIRSQTEAYQKAYNVDTATARASAARLLSNVNIVKRIEERKAEVALHANVTKEQVLGATALRAFATIDDAFNDQGEFDIKKARKTGAVHLIKKITRNQTEKGTNISVEFYSNESAQDRLGTYLGMEKQPETNPADVQREESRRLFADSLVKQGVVGSLEEAYAYMDGLVAKHQQILDEDRVIG